MDKIAIVVPTNRPASIARWQDEWRYELKRTDITLYIVRDEPNTWADIDSVLGKGGWVIPRRTDCIRSYGFLRAYLEGCDYIITMDDDCYPDTPDFIDRHVAVLKNHTRWRSTITGLTPRGMPNDTINGKRAGISHGLWTNVPDLAGQTQLITPLPYRYEIVDQYIPTGMYFPMSGMNLAFPRWMMPAMWFGLQGKEWGVERAGDIWCGLIVKKIADHLGITVHSGYPLVRHDRASDPVKNEIAERPALEITEWLWKAVDSVDLRYDNVPDCYGQLSTEIDLPNNLYWNKWREGAWFWRELIIENA